MNDDAVCESLNMEDNDVSTGLLLPAFPEALSHQLPSPMEHTSVSQS